MISGKSFILFVRLMPKHSSAGTLNPVGAQWDTPGTFDPFGTFPECFQMWFLLNLLPGAKPHHHSV